MNPCMRCGCLHHRTDPAWAGTLSLFCLCGHPLDAHYDPNQDDD